MKYSLSLGWNCLSFRSCYFAPESDHLLSSNWSEAALENSAVHPHDRRTCAPYGHLQSLRPRNKVLLLWEVQASTQSSGSCKVHYILCLLVSEAVEDQMYRTCWRPFSSVFAYSCDVVQSVFILLLHRRPSSDRIIRVRWNALILAKAQS